MFITFEGIECSGKTTQAKLLYEWFLDKGFKTILTREPGGTETAEKIRNIILSHHNEKFPSISELCLYIAARGFHVKNLIEPEIKKGTIVICDRFSDSTIAYQGYGRGLPLKLIESMDEMARNGITPDITFLIDIPIEESFKRMKGKNLDRIEKESIQFHQKVREGFLSLAKKHPERIVVLNGTRKVEEIFKTILTKVEEKLNES